MVKLLITCTLINIFCLFSVFAQDSSGVQVDSVKANDSHLFLKGAGNTAPAGRVSGYAGLMTTGSATGYYGGINYTLKENQSIRFEFLYGAGNNLLFQPGMNLNSRIIAPTLMYQYTIIGKSGNFTPYGYQAGSNGFSLYAFGGIGAQFYSQGTLLKSSETHLTNPKNANYSIVMPLGIGMHYKFDNNMTIGLEIRGNFHMSNSGYMNASTYGMNSYQNSYGQWGYPGVMFGQFRNGQGF
jgi:hypothetical protein